jgi:hypothetical protein
VSKKAIIILPGIMGSTIYAKSSFKIGSISLSKNDRVWDPPINIFTARHRVFSMKCDSEGKPLYDVGTLDPIVNNNIEPFRQYGGLNIYKKLYLRLCSTFNPEYDVILYEYDWRNDPYDTAVMLDKYIEENGYDEIVFISHSVRGNAASYYLAVGGDKNKKVKKHISVGAPYLGTEKLAYVYDTGDAVKYVVFGFNIVLPFIGNSIKSVMPNFPGIYSLLPIKTKFAPYLLEKRSHKKAELKKDFPQTMHALSTFLDKWNGSLYSLAVSHQWLQFKNGVHVTKLVDSYSIVGDGIKTPEKLVIHEDFASRKRKTIKISSKFFDGDGMISLRSSLIGDEKPSKVLFKYKSKTVDAEHIEMIKGEDDGKTFDFICDVISGSNVFSLPDGEFFRRYSGYKERRPVKN